MALSLLCLGLTLLGALKAQGHDTAPTLRPRPNLMNVPLQHNFQKDQFKGKWYAMAVAEDPIQDGSQFKMHSVIYEPKDDHSYTVVTTVFRGDDCIHQAGNIVQDTYPGQFTMNKTTLDNSVHSYKMRVVITDYDKYAIVFFEETHGATVSFKANLYWRTKEPSSAFREYFTVVAKYLSFAEDSINFSPLLEQCI